MIDAGNIEVSREMTDEFILCRAIATLGDNTAEVTISGGHIRIVEKKLNGEITFVTDAAAVQRRQYAKVSISAFKVFTTSQLKRILLPSNSS